MADQRLAPIPLGVTSFEKIKSGGYAYVDKTDLIYELTFLSDAPIFLSRPRRFGKSLLLSTLQSLFTHGTEYFKGLKIEKLWQDQTYKVLRLDFSAFSFTPETFEQKFFLYFKNCCKTQGIAVPPEAEACDPNSLLLGITALPENGRLVILIDEYDHPLIEFLSDKPAFLKVQSVLRAFYLAMKSCNDLLRLVFITGIARFSHTSIFSGFNNLHDISLEDEYAALLGFTEGEIRTYFAEAVNNLGTALGLSVDEVISRLKEHYDGYSFEMTAQTRVFNPWSVMKCLKSSRERNPFRNWWGVSGGMSRLLYDYCDDQIRAHKAVELILGLEDPHAECLIILSWDDLAAVSEFNHLNLEVILFLAGYLTFKEIFDDDSSYVGYPNLEVREFLKGHFLKYLIARSSETAADFPDRQAIMQAIISNDSQQLKTLLNRCLNVFPFSERQSLSSEKGFTALLGLVLRSCRLMVRREQESLLGKSDLMVEFSELTSRRQWCAIFEFKLADDPSAAKQQELLSKAREQLIKKRYYYQAPPGNEAVCFAGVFSRAGCELCALEKVEIPE